MEFKNEFTIKFDRFESKFLAYTDFVKSVIKKQIEFFTNVENFDLFFNRNIFNRLQKSAM